MSTDRGKSFLASLWVEGAPVNFSQVEESGGTVSNVRCEFMCANSNSTPMSIYFRYRHDHYVLFVRGGEKLGCVGTVHKGYWVGGVAINKYYFSAGVPDDNSMHVYLLDSSGQRITLDNISSDEVTVGMQFKFPTSFSQALSRLDLMPKNKVLSEWWSYLQCEGAGDGAIEAIFKLKILERNVPYLNDPNEV